MKPIGGYFELELQKGNHQYHDTPYKMKSGRAALCYILSMVKPSCVYVPFYSCNSVLEPFAAAKIKYKFYEIDSQFNPKSLPALNDGEYFLYINYLDLKRRTVAELSAKYKDKLITDCTHAFFMRGNGVSWFFNSCRKFFGVPDGSYLYPPSGANLPVIEAQNEGYITDHLIERFNGHPGDGYRYFLENEILADSSMYAMSKLSDYLLSHIDYNEVISKRRSNYAFVHQQFAHMNLFNAAPSDNVSIFYPLLLDKIVDRNQLAVKDIFISQFWKETLQNTGIEGFEFEKSLPNLLWPLPIDQRYTQEDMEVLCTAITGIL